MKKEKVFSLAYADDMVLLAKEEEGMRAMMMRLKGIIYKEEGI